MSTSGVGADDDGGTNNVLDLSQKLVLVSGVGWIFGTTLARNTNRGRSRQVKILDKDDA